MSNRRSRDLTERVARPSYRRGREPHPAAAGLPPFEHVLEAHGRPLLRFCAARAPRGRAEDVFQESMLAALRAYQQVRDPSSIRAWLFSIAARKAIDAQRELARAAEPVADPGPGVVDGEPAFATGEVWGHVRRLPRKQREAVTLRYLADLSHREIARAMRTSEEAARRNVFEGLERLRAELELHPIERTGTR